MAKSQNNLAATVKGHIQVLDFQDSKREFTKSDEILYEYIVKNSGWTEKELIEKFNVTKDRTKSFEIDLNDDGVNEIIGLNFASIYWSNTGYEFHILKKENNNYIDINYMPKFEPLKPMYILKSKTNGYHDIVLHTPYNPVLLINKDGYYTFSQSIK